MNGERKGTSSSWRTRKCYSHVQSKILEQGRSPSSLEGWERFQILSGTRAGEPDSTWRNSSWAHQLHRVPHRMSGLDLKGADMAQDKRGSRVEWSTYQPCPAKRLLRFRMFSTLIVYMNNCTGFVIFLLSWCHSYFSERRLLSFLFILLTSWESSLKIFF